MGPVLEKDGLGLPAGAIDVAFFPEFSVIALNPRIGQIFPQAEGPQSLFQRPVPGLFPAAAVEGKAVGPVKAQVHQRLKGFARDGRLLLAPFGIVGAIFEG